MSQDLTVTAAERQYLRTLALRYLEYAGRPIMAERAELWYAHNALKGQRPVIVFEGAPVVGEMIPAMQCTSKLARGLEWQMLTGIAEQDQIGDDRILTPEVTIPWKITCRDCDMDFHVERGTDDKGRQLGFHAETPIKDLAADLPKLKHSVYSVDRAGTMAHKAAAEEILGDILKVTLINQTLVWYAAPSYRIVQLMGMEAMLMAMMDQGDEIKRLYQFIADDMKQFMQWQEREGLLTPNNGNHYAGAGSYGFSRELTPNGKVQLKDMWLNMNSQETVGVSPDMFEEFAFPSYLELSKLGGLTYYGCCEPVHGIWERCISKLHNLRKVSVSPWCNEPAMGEFLKAAPVIYSRKPSPNYLAVGNLDEAAFSDHIEMTLRSAKGCHLEFIFRDVYALDGDTTKPARAMQIVRKLIDKMW